MLKNLKYSGNLEWLHSNTILLTVHGSHAYGLNTPDSDFDFKGVCVPPIQYFLGAVSVFEQAEFKDGGNNAEAVIYDIRKFFRLAADCNPNIIEVLWTEPVHHRICSPIGRLLIDNRDLFISKKARHTFAGYAASQIKRIKTHRRWLLYGEAISKPKRADFALPEHTIISADQLAAAHAAIDKKLAQWNLTEIEFADPASRIGLSNAMAELLAEIKVSNDSLWRNAARTIGYGENFIDILDRERRYRAAKAEWDNYQNWKATRNPTRAALEAKYHYDTKHGSHLVRLMRMCREILTTGRVVVYRPDRDELLAIRNGAWSYDQIVSWFEEQDAQMDDLYKKSTLPKSPDRNALDELCQSIVLKALNITSKEATNGVI